MRKLGAALVSFSLLSAAAMTMTIMACHANPDIKGASVATVGSPTDIPTCAQDCARLAGLCGYAPIECTLPDAGGFCDVNFTDPNELLCIGYGTLNDAGTYDLTQSCQAAWDCVDNPPTNGYFGGGLDAGSSDDSGDDTDGGDLDGATDS